MENQPLGKIVFAHLQQLQELTVIRSYKRVETMLAQLLGWLGQKFGREVVEGKLIELRLTHQDLGDILGITRVTVTRTLNQLEQQGLIERLPLHQIILRESEVWYYQI
jgi:CRP-like cAMP-binding protein